MTEAQTRTTRRKPTVVRTGEPWSYINLWREPPLSRITLIKDGIPAVRAKRLFNDLDISQALFLKALNMSQATVNKKAARNETLPTDQGERVLGVARLIGQLQAIVEESGDPDGFNTAAWISRWLSEPLPALGGARPIELLDTMEGQNLVSRTLAKIQNGAYA